MEDIELGCIHNISDSDDNIQLSHNKRCIRAYSTIAKGAALIKKKELKIVLRLLQINVKGLTLNRYMQIADKDKNGVLSRS